MGSGGLGGVGVLLFVAGVLFVAGIGLLPGVGPGLGLVLGHEVEGLAQVDGMHGAPLSGGGADGEHPVVLGHGPYPGGLEPVVVPAAATTS